MESRFHELARISPSSWPEKQLEVRPGDFSMIVPMGVGLSGPMPVLPWDNLEDAVRRPSYYAYHGRRGHPVLDAPVTEAAGGAVYFDSRATPEDLLALLRLMEVHTGLREYAVFLRESENSLETRTIAEFRIVSRFALRFMFGAIDEAAFDAFPPQERTVAELVAAFVEHERQRFGVGMSRELEGRMGGDGDWAREALCFGMMVENSYQGVWRIWSRCWLVTK